MNEIEPPLRGHKCKLCACWVRWDDQPNEDIPAWGNCMAEPPKQAFDQDGDYEWKYPETTSEDGCMSKFLLRNGMGYHYDYGRILVPGEDTATERVTMVVKEDKIIEV